MVWSEAVRSATLTLNSPLEEMQKPQWSDPDRFGMRSSVVPLEICCQGSGTALGKRKSNRPGHTSLRLIGLSDRLARLTQNLVAGDRVRGEYRMRIADVGLRTCGI